MPMNKDGFFVSSERLKAQVQVHRGMAAAYLRIATSATQERAEHLAQIETSKAERIEREYFV